VIHGLLNSGNSDDSERPSATASFFKCNFCTVVQQLTRFQLTLRIMQYLCDSQASCQIEVGWTKLHFFYQSSQSCHRCFTTKKLCPPTGGMIRYMPMVHDIAVNKVSPWMLARLQTWSAIIFSWVCLSVCLSVCVRVSLTSTSTLQRWPILMKLGHKDPTMIWFGRDHNGPDQPQRDRMMPFWKFQKIL